jgi:hypothetical protein
MQAAWGGFEGRISQRLGPIYEISGSPYLSDGRLHSSAGDACGHLLQTGTQASDYNCHEKKGSQLMSITNHDAPDMLQEIERLITASRVMRSNEFYA